MKQPLSLRSESAGFTSYLNREGPPGNLERPGKKEAPPEKQEPREAGEKAPPEETVTSPGDSASTPESDATPRKQEEVKNAIRPGSGNGSPELSLVKASAGRIGNGLLPPSLNIGEAVAGSREKAPLTEMALRNMEAPRELATKPAVPEPAQTFQKAGQAPPARQESTSGGEPSRKSDAVNDWRPDLKPEAKVKPGIEKNTDQPQANPVLESRPQVRMAATTETSAATRGSPPSHKVIDQVQDAIQMLWQKGEERIVIRLSPPELGKVQIELFRKDQTIEVKISTENQGVRELLMSNAEQLKQNLQNSGVNLRNFEVNIGNFRDFFQYANHGNQSNPRQQNGFLPEYGLPADDQGIYLREENLREFTPLFQPGRLNLLI